MRQIRCASCRAQASWIVFKRLMICDSCRLTVMNYLLAQGFSFGHPFMDEFTTVTRKHNPHN